jgi:hypothetical protein
MLNYNQAKEQVLPERAIDSRTLTQKCATSPTPGKAQTQNGQHPLQQSGLQVNETQTKKWAK